MDIKPRICQACCSHDRNLYSLKEVGPFLLITKIYQLPLLDGGICWECKSIIKKFTNFLYQVQKAQELISVENQVCLSRLSSSTKLGFDVEYDFEFIDPLQTEIDENLGEEIKVENSYSDEEIKDFFASDGSNFEETLKESQMKLKTNKHMKEKKSKFKTEFQIEVKQEIDTDSESKYKRNGDKSFKDYYELVNISEKEVQLGREKKRKNSNYKILPFKCDSCVLGFRLGKLFMEHMISKHAKIAGKYQCDICLVRYPRKSHLKRHITKHFSFYKCKFCKLETGELSFMEKHCREKHTGDTLDSIHCSECDLVAKSPEEMDHHMKTHRPQCDICKETFSCHAYLNEHQRRIHSSKRPFICDHCKKTFKSKPRLETHMAKHGDSYKQKLTYCDVCKIQYKTVYGYRKHLTYSSVHSKVTHLCEECGKTFVTKVYLRQHMQFIHQKKSRFKCKTCDKMFISRWRLTNHMQVNHGLERTRNFTCNVCGKMFYSKAVLSSHLGTHSVERKYTCTECGSTFKQSGTLYNHKKLKHKGWMKRDGKSELVSGQTFKFE